MMGAQDHLRYAGADPATHRAVFEQIVRGDDTLMDILRRARDLALPDWRLVAGCLYQSVWNWLTGRPHGHGIKDYDLAYYDPRDLSWEAEDKVIKRAAIVFSDLSAPVEVRNQARVHLWFEDHFGVPYPALRSTEEGIDRYACVAHKVGVRLEANDRLDLYAPDGLGDIFRFVLRPNRVMDNAATHQAKAARVTRLWPELTVERWAC